MNSLGKLAYQALYEDVENYTFEIKYSAKFTSYNGNIRYFQSKNHFQFSISKSWIGVSPEIVIGLLQYLLQKMKNTKKRTLNIDLYEHFIKNVSKYTKAKVEDPLLQTIFDTLNDQFFLGLLDPCSLKWGSFSKRTLGHYNFGTDVITLSTVLKDLPLEKSHLLELVMYHEMLHKKHQFKSSKTGLQNMYHTKEFRADERKFPNYVQAEKELHQLVRYKRVPKTPKKDLISQFKRFLG